MLAVRNEADAQSLQCATYTEPHMLTLLQRRQHGRKRVFAPLSFASQGLPWEPSHRLHRTRRASCQGMKNLQPRWVLCTTTHTVHGPQHRRRPEAVRTQGTDLNYEIQPALSPETSMRGSKNAAMFVHGFMTDIAVFDDVLAEESPLREYATCARYDMRGFGRSPNPTTPYSHVNDLADIQSLLSRTFTTESDCQIGTAIPQASDAKSNSTSASGESASAGPDEEDSTLDSVDGERLFAPTHLVGYGLGGSVVLEYALKFPERVRSVSVISTGITGHAWKRGMSAFFELPDDLDSDPFETSRYAQDGRLVQKASGSGTLESRLQNLARDWLRASPEWSTGLASQTQDCGAKLKHMLRRYKCFHFAEEDPVQPNPFEGRPLLERIGDLKVPVMAMAGQQEATGDFGLIAKEILDVVPQPAFMTRTPVLLNGARHFGPIEAPEQCRDELLRFWRSVDDRRKTSGLESH